jgi:O-acetyl-ADP-ribose deacetylase (regulator of RNase III)
VVPSPRYSGDARSDPEARRHNGDYLALTPQPPQVVRTATFNRMKFTNTFITCAKGSVVYARGRKTEKAATQNAANEHMMGGGGLDGAISGRGGEGLHRARSRLPFVAPNVRCETGDAVITPSGDFKNQKVGHIIHAVGPNFHLLMDNNHGMMLLLKATLATMRIAKEADIQELFMGIVSGGIFRASVPLKTIVQIILMAVISSTYVGLKEVMITGFSDEEVTCIQETIREFSTPNGFKNFLDTMSTDFIEAIYRPL